MMKVHGRSFWANAGLFALALTMTQKVAPYLGDHAEYEPFTIKSFLEWTFNLDHLAFCAVFAYVAVVLNFGWLRQARGMAVVLAAVVVAAQFSAMAIPFDGRVLESAYRYFDITDLDLMADIKLVLALLSPLSAWLVFWIDVRIRRARVAEPA